MFATMASYAGSPDKPNEDWAGVTPTTAVVLDGLSSPAELPTGCIHSVNWYVNQLGSSLIARAATSSESLADCLSSAIVDVTDRHQRTCDLDNPGTPQATVAMVRIEETTASWLVLADSIVVFDVAGEVKAIVDHRVDDTATAERGQALSSTDDDARRSNISLLVSAQRKLRNREGGYWVAGSDPAAAQHALVGSSPLADVSRFAILSDGAGRIAEFGATDWPGVLEIMSKVGPSGLISKVRELERLDSQAKRWPRYKVSDDATAIYATWRNH